ncbi:MAG: hypothetical protein AMJ79_10415 [Phycisphaerae bacterium SM23_30]|nr:MAG: hypothetical protein AMJ79_10415 [Phycisphaerae bacterium SM23_30]
MAQKSKKKKKTKPPELHEDTWFIPDDRTEPTDKNAFLANYLNARWSKLNIVKIKRIEIGNSGWLATYRK